MTTNKQKSSNPAFFLTFFIFMILIDKISSAPESDKIAGIPGYPENFNSSVYSGYLKTSSDDRKLHYVFIQNEKGAKNALPITLWLNGGPGCASKIGLLQQIAPYVLPLTGDYVPDQQLVKNPFSWLTVSNLLFIDSPAGVGYSVNKDQKYVFNDANTAKDNIDALIDFFTNKFPQYLINPFYIAGQSYAGKYIPDLAIQIVNYNSQSKDHQINLKGILLGNPGLNFKSGSLEDSEIEFMMTHHFIDPKIFPNWKTSCHSDPASAGCQFFYSRYEQLMKRVDFYNIYGPCLTQQTHASQAGFMKTTAKLNSRISQLDMENDWPWTWTQFSECFNDDPINKYFQLNAQAFKSEVSSNFLICNSSIYKAYQISETGSMNQLQALIQKVPIKIYFFSGDWDDVIPFTDTVKNIERMGLKQDQLQIPMKSGTQHIGFVRNYENKKNVRFYILKGAGHEAVAYKPEAAYQMFVQFLSA